MPKKWLFLLIVGTVLLAGVGLAFAPRWWSRTDNVADNVVQVEAQEIVREVANADDYVGAKVKREDLIQGCPTGQDCIQSLDNPTFVAADEIPWLSDEDIVFVVEIAGERHVYPRKILLHHELVNDRLGNTPFVMTYCSLCGSTNAFERVVDGVVTEFGASGFLQDSCMVMYDRYEGNLWQQITGDAVVGKAAVRDESLNRLPVIVTTWGRWKAIDPNSLVLSDETVFGIDYAAPNQFDDSYVADDRLRFDVSLTDDRLPPKAIVYGLQLGEKYMAWSAEGITPGKSQTALLDDAVLTISLDSVGRVLVNDASSGRTYNPERLMWFAWFVYHPTTFLVDVIGESDLRR